MMERTCTAFEENLEKSLKDPLSIAMRKSSKKVRGELVRVFLEAFCNELFLSQPKMCKELESIVENLHTSSIIIDDIEDGTQIRRGEPALHIQVGLPTALNAANWLLLFPFLQIRSLELSPQKELVVTRLLQDTLMTAHEGQAVDLNTDASRCSQSDFYELWKTTTEKKTGALMAFAAILPCHVADMDELKKQTVYQFGKNFGVALQMFDDIADFFLKEMSEDLVNRRLNWCMAVASTEFSQVDFLLLQQALKALPASQMKLNEITNKHSLMQSSVDKARNYFDKILSELYESKILTQSHFHKIVLLKEKLINAFLNT